MSDIPHLIAFDTRSHRPTYVQFHCNEPMSNYTALFTKILIRKIKKDALQIELG
ncbi:unknown protein [Microcystis aeruginosa NIES-843]|uniref:Uncharacterized protein n=1 Tax=Microcystis aeruginosa (strain NIES-843 / IAM M-2473) TaxID=449447 RepID=B0JFX5_MICAN|nr:unknown protein [Microcystis aeruginosa NIES-843]